MRVHLCIDMCDLLYSSDSVLAMVVKETMYCLFVKRYA